MSRLTHNILKEFHNKSILVNYTWEILIKSSEQLKRTTNEVDDTTGFSHWSEVRSLTIDTAKLRPSRANHLSRPSYENDFSEEEKHNSTNPEAMFESYLNALR